MKRKVWVIIGVIVFVIVAIYLSIAAVIYSRAVNDLEAIRAAGDPVDLADLVPPEVAEEENAAILLAKAFEKIETPGPDTAEAKNFLLRNGRLWKKS